MGIMRISIKKWGNSLGLRIPKIFAVQLGIDEGKELDVNIEGNSIVISNPSETLDELLEKITDENIHGETDFGSPIGKEVW